MTEKVIVKDWSFHQRLNFLPPGGRGRGAWKRFVKKLFTVIKQNSIQSDGQPNILLSNQAHALDRAIDGVIFP